ncbi:MAG: PHP domain-containing protein, partial [Robiginitalea sp.]|nr:PHP domain-containing protein [Robiginitalea sp.]
MYLIFDTETTGLPKRWDAPVSDTDNWPRCVQIAWQLHDEVGGLIEQYDTLVRPDGFNIPYDSEQIHGISTDLALGEGKPLSEVLEAFVETLGRTRFLVGQNVGFDINVMGAECYRVLGRNPLEAFPVLDTCTEETAELCRLPGGRGGKFKLPTLTELHQHLFGEPFEEAHNASADVEATTRCFLELIRRRSFKPEELQVTPDYFEKFREANPGPIALLGLKHQNLKKASEVLAAKKSEPDTGLSRTEIEENKKAVEGAVFAHLHNHTQFSVLQSTIKMRDLVAATAAHGMPAVAMTDHANMMGAFHFVKEVNAFNKSQEALPEEERKPAITPIVGCEFFVCEDRHNKSVKDYGYQIVMLTKNKNGYHNLAKMSSIAYTEGFYYVPRIDREVVARYKEDIIVLTGNLYGEVPSKILNQGEKQAEEALLWWKEHFGDDLYVELMRHGQED